MGFAIRYSVEAFRCEFRSCPSRFDLIVPLSTQKPMWADVVEELATAVREGWAVVLLLRLKSYCPEHRQFASECTCERYYKPQRRKRCVVHSDSAGALLWDDQHVPDVVAGFVDDRVKVGVRCAS